MNAWYKHIRKTFANLKIQQSRSTTWGGGDVTNNSAFRYKQYKHYIWTDKRGFERHKSQNCFPPLGRTLMHGSASWTGTFSRPSSAGTDAKPVRTEVPRAALSQDMDQPWTSEGNLSERRFSSLLQMATGHAEAGARLSSGNQLSHCPTAPNPPPSSINRAEHTHSQPAEKIAVYMAHRCI